MEATFDDALIRDALCRDSLFAFTWQAFQLLDPNPADGFIPNWHVEAMCHALEEVVAGRTPKLIITIPPRHLKSICASVALPAWLMGHNPSAKILVASYGSDLAAKHSRDTRTVMESALYQRLFPGTRLTITRELELGTDRMGMRKGVSLGGPVTGFGGDYLIIDDLIKAIEALSPIELRRVQDYYTGTLYSRLNDQRNPRIIVIQQRLHEDDLVGFLLETGTFKHLNLPAIAECDEAIPIGGGLVHRRQKGEALFPQLQPLDKLAEMRRDVGSSVFSAQYQQNPVPPGGNRLRWEWFGILDGIPQRSWFHYLVQSWDTAYSAEPTSDFSVCTTWGFREGSWYLVDVHRARYDYPDLLRRAAKLSQDWDPDTILIERGSTGTSMYQDLERRGLRSKLFLMNTCQGKDVRFEVQTAKLETGNFLVPKEAAWLEEFKRECLAFPKGRNDDQVDSMTQFLYWTGLRKAAGRMKRKDYRTPQPRSYGRLVRY